MEFVIRPIGIIHSPFRTKHEAPVQGALSPDAEGTVEVFADYALALKDIETFTHLYLLYRKRPDLLVKMRVIKPQEVQTHA